MSAPKFVSLDLVFGLLSLATAARAQDVPDDPGKDGQLSRLLGDSPLTAPEPAPPETPGLVRKLEDAKR